MCRRTGSWASAPSRPSSRRHGTTGFPDRGVVVGRGWRVAVRTQGDRRDRQLLHDRTRVSMSRTRGPVGRKRTHRRARRPQRGMWLLPERQRERRFATCPTWLYPAREAAEPPCGGQLTAPDIGPGGQGAWGKLGRIFGSRRRAYSVCGTRRRGRAHSGTPEATVRTVAATVAARDLFRFCTGDCTLWNACERAQIVPHPCTAQFDCEGGPNVWVQLEWHMKAIRTRRSRVRGAAGALRSSRILRRHRRCQWNSAWHAEPNCARPTRT